MRTPAGSVSSASVFLTFPANAATSSRTYTLRVSLNGGATWEAAPTATVTVEPAPSALWITIDRAGITIENRANATVSVTVNVGGMPPNRFFPVEAGGSASPGISIDGLPPNIEVSGHVVTNALGNGSGTVTLTMATPMHPTRAEDQAELLRLAEGLFGE